MIFLHKSREDRIVAETDRAALRLIAAGYERTTEANYMNGWRECDQATIARLRANAPKRRGIYEVPA